MKQFVQILILVFLIINIHATAQIPTNGLVGYWPFTGNANDMSGNSNNGTVYNATLCPDRFGNANCAYDFNGTNAYIGMPSSASFNLLTTGGFSSSCWAYFDGTAGYVYSFGTTGYAGGIGYQVIFGTESKVHFSNWNAGSSAIYLHSGVVTIATWHHIVVTMDYLTNQTKLYIDGTLDPQSSNPIAIVPIGAILNIGRNTNESSYLNGNIDDFRFYNRALSQTEITALYNSLSFTKQTSISLTPVNYGNHKCADFVDINNDDLLDLFITGSTNISGTAGFTGIYTNNGDNTFSSISGLPFSGFFGSEGDWGDYNNDGFVDLLLSAESNAAPGGGGTRIYKNNGNNTFTQILNIDRGLCVTWGDYNNDGKLDFALAEGGSYSAPFTIKIYQNNGADSFSQDLSIVFPTTTQKYTRLNWFDYNKDGYMDLIALRADSTLLYKNNGNGTFSKVSSFNLPISGGSSSLAFVDYNNDGFLDIFKSDNKVYLNDAGNGTFTAVSLNTMSSFYGGNDWGDFNNDGKPDMLISGSSPNLTKIYRNDGSNIFTDIGASITGISQWSSVKWGDYNNDGFLDFIIDGYSDYTGYKCAELYKSNGEGPVNTPPSAPGSLVSTVNGNSVILSWNAASDIQTNSNALTYNVRVGTSPGSNNIVSAMANLSTGFRRTPVNGNAFTNLLSKLENLTSGTYYWSVQAIDQAYAGSAFAQESSFTISSVPSTQATNIIFSNIQTNQFTFNFTDGNGSKRAVFIKQDSVGTAIPVNNNTYTANSSFSAGTQIGTTGWYCVFNGTAHTSGVTITNLQPNTKYRVMVCEYNGGPGSEQYNISSTTNNPNNQKTFPIENICVGIWATRTSMPTPRTAAGSAVVNGKVYIIGGQLGTPNTTTNIVEEFDPITNTWTVKNSMPTPRYGFGISVVNNKILCIGGTQNNSNRLTVNEVYDPTTNTWETKVPMPEGRTSLRCETVNGKIYAMGGWIDWSNWASTVFEYDPISNTWTTKQPMPMPNGNFASVVLENLIHVIGGGWTWGFQDVHYVYDPSSDIWSALAPLPIPRGGMPAEVLKNKIYVIGGATSISGFPPGSNINEVYDPISNSWSYQTNMFTARTNLCLENVNDTLYAIGGQISDFGTQSINEEFSLSGPSITTHPQSVTICKDGNASFSVVATGISLTYQWYKDGVLLLNGNGQPNYTVNNAQSSDTGNYYCIVTSNCGSNQSNSAFLTVMLVPDTASAISGLSSVCVGALGVSYSVPTISHAENYSWTLPFGATITSGAGTDSILVNFSNYTSVGNFSVFGTNQCFSGISSPNYTVTSNAPLTGTLYLNNITITGTQDECMAVQEATTGETGSPFIVQSGGQLTLIASQRILLSAGTTVQQGGYFHGLITSQCLRCPDLKNTVADSGSKEEILSEDWTSFKLSNSILKVYPNPTSGIFNLELIGLGTTDRVKIEIYSIQGEKIIMKTMDENVKQEFSISDRPKGIYFIRLISGKSAETVKIIKQ